MERRKRLDHERYMRNRSERLAKQHDYYFANREEILAKKHEKQVRKVREAGVVVDKVVKLRAYHREWYRKNRSRKNNETKIQIPNTATDIDARPV